MCIVLSKPKYPYYPLFSQTCTLGSKFLGEFIVLRIEHETENENKRGKSYKNKFKKYLSILIVVILTKVFCFVGV